MKKYLSGGIGVAVVALAIASAIALVASAQSPNASTNAVSGPIMISINPNGKVLLRGTIESVGATTVVVKSWGGSWTIKIAPTSTIVSTNRSVSDFKVGNIVGVSGTMAQDGSFAIDASLLRLWGQRFDNDKDGLPDNQDQDDDNDGTSDINDSKPRDHDNDGKNDDVDADDDGDGIDDANETGKVNDHDNDGISDSQDQDDDNDGISDSNDAKKLDRDNDGKDDDIDKDD